MTAYAAPVRNSAAQINVTPLVDVLLVLLVIFMLAVPSPSQRLALTNVPPCREDCRQLPTPVRLAIKRTGELYWNGAAINRADLAANLSLLARQPKSPALEIHPEARARYALVTDVLAAARNADVQQ